MVPQNVHALWQNGSLNLKAFRIEFLVRREHSQG